MKTLAADFRTFATAFAVVIFVVLLCATVTACKTTPRTRVDLPDGTRVETRGNVDKPATVTKDATGKLTITTPTTPPPPAPPTPTEQAEGWRVKAYTTAALGCVLLAALFAWGSHWLAAIFAGTAAATLHFFSTPESPWIAGICLGIAAALCAAWYISNHKLSTDTLAHAVSATTETPHAPQ